MKDQQVLGNHILVEFTGCQPKILNDVIVVEEAMNAAALDSGATVLNSTFHHFSPYGISGVIVIQESHLAIHTWPEYGYAAVDLFTCGDQIDSWKAFDRLKSAFASTNYSAIEMRRGSIGLMNRLDFDSTSMRSDNSSENQNQMYHRNVWFTDKDDEQALSLRYKGKPLFDVKSPHQRVKILETYRYGKLLALDDMIMTTEKDEYHYHEMICHPAMFTHGNIESVLVIGGGDGGTIREVLKHESVKKVTMVELDEVVVEACRNHLPLVASVFEDSRLHMLIDDGIKYLDRCDQNFDLILIDGSDPVGPSKGLFEKSFYENCKRCLSENGILVARGESPRFNESAFYGLNTVLQSLFGYENTKVSLFYAPTYPSGMWSFQWGMNSNDFAEIDPLAVERFVEKAGLKYYNSQIHMASLALPNEIKRKIELCPKNLN